MVKKKIKAFDEKTSVLISIFCCMQNPIGKSQLCNRAAVAVSTQIVWLDVLQDFEGCTIGGCCCINHI